MQITKNDGTKEPFNEKKLRASLRRSGAKKDVIDEVVAEVEAVMYEGMHTSDIYRHAFAHLRTLHESTPVIARYSMRRALFDLGPTGFPFEQFLKRLFEAEGYSTRVGIVMNGRCAQHEIDIAAYKDDHSFIAEAKFHVRHGLKSDLQVAMYSYARLQDLSDQKICREDICGVKNLKLITNTHFTTAAIKYAECAGVDLLSWDYPKKGNLFDLIEKHNLHPVTAIQSLSKAQKKVLLETGLVVCTDVLKHPQKLKPLNLSSKRTETLLSEIRQLCSGSQ